MSAQWQIESLSPYSRNALHLRLEDSTEIPFAVIVGEIRSPVVLVMAGVHGDEYEGPTAIQDLAMEIDPKMVRGSIVFVPVANPAAFAATTRRHPADQGDLNRSFPGDPEGAPTARLANVLFQEFALAANCILSLHGWSKESALLPYAEYADYDTEAARISRRAAYAIGFRYLHPYQWPDGVLGNATLERGIPIVEAEVGGAGTVTTEGQKLYREVILRFLAHFEILEFEAASPPQPLIISHSDLLATCAGLFRSCVRVGDRVTAGQQLGSVRSLDGKCLQTVRAPRDGIVGILRLLASVQQSNLLFQLFWNIEGV